MIVNEHVLSLNNDYAFLSEIRNQYNHAGMLYSTKFNSEKMIENIKNLLNEITNKISESC
jgi:argininosuccinate lyase